MLAHATTLTDYTMPDCGYEPVLAECLHQMSPCVGWQQLVAGFNSRFLVPTCLTEGDRRLMTVQKLGNPSVIQVLGQDTRAPEADSLETSG